MAGDVENARDDIGNAAGDIVLLLDSDDVLYPETAAIVAGAFQSDPDLAFVQPKLPPGGRRPGTPRRST